MMGVWLVEKCGNDGLLVWGVGVYLAGKLGENDGISGLGKVALEDMIAGLHLVTMEAFVGGILLVHEFFSLSSWKSLVEGFDFESSSSGAVEGVVTTCQ